MIHIGDTIDPTDYYNLKSKLEVDSKTKIAIVLHYSTSIHCRIYKFQQIVFLISAVQNKSINFVSIIRKLHELSEWTITCFVQPRISPIVQWNLLYLFIELLFSTVSSQSIVQISNEIFYL